jgi:hypothetical protein
VISLLKTLIHGKTAPYPPVYVAILAVAILCGYPASVCTSITLLWAWGMGKSQLTLKYATEIAQYPNCPHPECSPRSGNVYRFVSNPISDNDFLPHALRWPDTPGFRCCVGYALSLFDSREQAVSRHAELNRTTKGKFALKSGGHLAIVELDAAHGIAKPADSRGHFEFFEGLAVDLKVVSKFDGPIDA